MQQADVFNVSSNELTALLKRVFEAMGCDQSALEDAAYSIVAAESRGFPTLDTLPKILERLQGEKPAPASGVDKNTDWLEINGNCSSVACYGSVFADLAAAYVKRVNKCVFVRVRSCHERLMILHALLSNAASGVPMLAYWNRQSPPDQWCAYLASSEPAADQYLEYTLSDKTSSPDCLNLIAAPEFEQILPHWQQIQAQSKQQKAISAAEIQHRFELSISNGIPIQRSLWEHLQQIALNVLVPSSERSRAGAGA
ncbi:MAG: DUF3726 domain-containing protein [Pseudomonadota bacterium]